jgi:hypothetical protein
VIGHGIDIASFSSREFETHTKGGDMRQDMAEHECSREIPAAKDATEKGRVLTYDETKAAEAAFRGDPFNPSWSAAAAEVYAGIAAAMAKQNLSAPSAAATESETRFFITRLSNVQR